MTVSKTLWVALSLVSTGAWANPAPVTELGRNNTPNQQLANPGSGTLEQRLATLERVVEARAQGQIRMQQQLNVLLEEVSQLRGVTETHTYQLDEMLQRQRDLYQEIDRRVGALQNNTPVQPVVSANDNTVPTVSYSSNVSENEAYDKAVNMVLKDRRYDAAIPEFEAFLQNYPDSGYAPNAHYWLGQLLYNTNELAKAKTHFERVVANFKDSNKVPDALLKLGQVAERENNKETALRYYRQLTSEHASATSARLAQERIDALK
ncbi:tol-pal system protein YbgF [Arsukibacterium indicum]|uniref:Cell division coordinator CpoB n=1 Tax=Arsukibacterium indicum TaxID=2848612 RepID=A0ABS6MIK4_9GAMM|nr:tol-pal system protein YbgF [Arsukibacterium indicum]MBV2128645.1 tol-pal system protein YbgF [Arsukibacterium indicum]